MPIGEDIKQVWSGPGKKWILAGGVAGLGYLWWTRVRGSDGAAASSSGVQFSPSGAAVADPIVPAGGDYSPPAENAGRPATNGEWLGRATDVLSKPPHNMSTITVWNALLGALAGEQLTPAQVAIVERAIQLIGTPPEGMPPVNAKAPTSTTPTEPAPERNPTYDTDPHHTVKAGDSLTRFLIVYFDGNAAEWMRINADTPTTANIRWTATGPVFIKDMTYRLPGYVLTGNRLPY